MSATASPELAGVAGRVMARRLILAAAAVVLLAAVLLIFEAAGGARLAAILAAAAAAILFAIFFYVPRRESNGAAFLSDSRFGRGFDPDQFLENADEAALIIDLSGAIRAGNAHLAALLGVDPDRVARGDFADLMPGPLLEAITTMFEMGLDSTGVLECENDVGEWIVVEVRRHRVEIASGAAFALTVRDFTEVRRREVELATLAFQDQLTGLANRAALQRRLARLKDDLCEGPEASFAIMVLDLDGFKQVNDRHGHAVGDEALIEASRRIVAATPRNAFVSRNGGDEFVIVLGPRASSASMRSVADGILEAVAKPMALSAGVAVVGVSIGVVLTPADGEEPGALLDAADAAMYRAKRAGRGVVFANEPREPSARTAA